jgi:Luciferase-like monooxygenase
VVTLAGRLSDRDRLIALDCYDHRVLTTEQLRRLHFDNLRTQELSGGRFTLGVGMGWHKAEFEFMGVEFEGRGARGDEALRVMRALWSGERDFARRYR